MSAKKEKLLEILKDNPKDTFCIYTLALEEKNHGSLEIAIKYLDQLLHIDPDYVSAYFQKSLILIDQDELDSARSSLDQAASAARRTRDFHALEEILALKETL